MHGLQINSNIKTTIDNWYASNLADEAEYLDGAAGFCGDRTPSTSSSSSNGSGGTGTTTTYYGSYIRLVTNKSPSFKCADAQDLYTTTASSKGNEALTNSIGLITADEISFAGGVQGIFGTDNNSYYLYNNDYYWTMSSATYGSSGALVFFMTPTGSLYHHLVVITDGVRPVINLRADVSLTGTGTSTDPFRIAGA